MSLSIHAPFIPRAEEQSSGEEESSEEGEIVPSKAATEPQSQTQIPVPSTGPAVVTESGKTAEPVEQAVVAP